MNKIETYCCAKQVYIPNTDGRHVSLLQITELGLRLFLEESTSTRVPKSPSSRNMQCHREHELGEARFEC
jgi:hypothetical protein